MPHTKYFNFFYAALSFLILSMPSGIDPIVYKITKPLIMISLIGWAIFGNDARKVPGKNPLVIGMFFALAGDCFLMFNGYFLEGLGSFLVMQWCYIIAFRKDFASRIDFKSAMMLLIPIIIPVGILLNTLLGSIDDTTLSIAVTVYTFSIGTMLWMSLLRKFFFRFTSTLLVSLGALLFTISDSLIAWNKFVEPVEHSHILIMSTYMAAQYLITRGMLKIPA